MPGSFERSHEFRSSIWGDNAYFGRAVADASQTIASIGAWTTGSESCNDNLQTDWDVSFTFANAHHINLLGSGGYNGDWWDCLFNPHWLIWTYSATWTNAGAGTFYEDDSDSCDLRSETNECVAFFQEP